MKIVDIKNIDNISFYVLENNDNYKVDDQNKIFNIDDDVIVNQYGLLELDFSNQQAWYNEDLSSSVVTDGTLKEKDLSKIPVPKIKEEVKIEGQEYFTENNMILDQVSNETINKQKSLVFGYSIAMYLIAIGYIIALISLLFIKSDMITYAGYLIAGIGIAILVVEKVRQDKILNGVLLYLLGTFTFGIWPFFSSKRAKRSLEEDLKFGRGFAYKDEYMFYKSLLKSYKYAMYILIVGMFMLFFVIGIYIVYIGAIIVGIQKIREEKILVGLLIIVLGWMTLGIWPLFEAISNQSRLKAKIAEIQENEY